VTILDPCYLLYYRKLFEFISLINDDAQEFFFETVEYFLRREGQHLFVISSYIEFVTAQISFFPLKLIKFFIDSALKTADFCSELHKIIISMRSIIIPPNIDGTIFWVYLDSFE
jgi:hypothetical protein